jgi:hypothetical protein
VILKFTVSTICYKNIISPLSRYCATNLTRDNGTTVDVGYIVCFAAASDSNDHMYIIKASLMFVSLAFLVLTLYIYYLIPDLRQTLDKVTACGVASLLVFMTVLSMVQFQYFAYLDLTCRVIGN